ncbi:hypothetical protein [Streptomyces sp. NPDC058657]|uniref:hypothetical protein n=1 Tax=unclassified Streptomyces TaxID=2593676 RepID=UPI00364D52B6
MTDTTLTATEAPPPVAPSDTPPAPPEQKAPAAATVEHTPGGWPVVPLAVTGTNTTASLLAAASLAGGPVALAVAATGAVVLGAVAATARHRQGDKEKSKPGARKPRLASKSGSVGGRVRGFGGGTSASRGARPGASGKVPAARRPAGGLHAATSRTGSAGAPRSGRSGSAGGGLHRSPGSARGSIGRGGAGRGGVSAARSRAGEVRALRDGSRQSAPTRAAQRAQTTTARRNVADARRDARAAARTRSASGKGLAGRALNKGAAKVRAATRGARNRLRAASDRQAAGKVGTHRSQVRRAPARQAGRRALRHSRRVARRALIRSAARFQARRLLAALFGGVLGIFGMVTTPLGRWLGWNWLQYPGRRLYRRLTGAARQQRDARDNAIRDQRAARDEAIRAQQAAEEDAADTEGEEGEVGDAVQRPDHLVPQPAAPASASSEGENVSGFRFEEYASEMENAANSYEPEDAMEILAMVEGLPAALTSVANVMRILAERSDSEFPLEKEVASGFDDIYGALMSAVAVADDMGPLFRQVHEQDIARHEDPRNGPEAEKGWNV